MATKRPSPYHVRLSIEEQTQLKQLAEAEGKKPHAIARMAIRHYLEIKKPSVA